jgi:hypothetical protein
MFVCGLEGCEPTREKIVYSVMKKIIMSGYIVCVDGVHAPGLHLLGLVANSVDNPAKFADEIIDAEASGNR